MKKYLTHNKLLRAIDLKTEEEIFEFIKELEEKNMILDDFPFFNKESPFYYNKKDLNIIEVDKEYIKEPLFNEENESINTLQL
jgi:hypothetical protein